MRLPDPFRLLVVGLGATLAVGLAAAPAGAAPAPRQAPAQTQATAVAPTAVEQTRLADVPPAADVSARSATTTRELTRAEPFTMAALTWTGAAPTDAAVRARDEAGTWGEWQELAALDAADDSAGAAPVTGSDPVFLDRTTTVQVRTSADPAALTLVVLDPDETPTPAADVSASAARPAIISRAGWGADEALHCQAPEYASRVTAAVVHHTETSNDYSAAQSAGIIRGIYAYHARTLGWCDIGYHVLVDRYGQVFEGAAGGLDRAVIGAHAGGFNTGTVGAVMIGSFTSVAPTAAALEGTARYLAWQATLWGLDPRGSTQLTSGGGVYTPYPAGQVVTKPQIMGHRDVDSTACPGNQAYPLLPALRDRVAQLLAGPVATTSSVTVSTNTAVGVAVALFGTVAPGAQGGTARFTLDGAPLPGCEARAVSGGVVNCVTTVATPGEHRLGIDYGGSDTHRPSSGATTATFAATADPLQAFLGLLIGFLRDLRLFGL